MCMPFCYFRSVRYWTLWDKRTSSGPVDLQWWKLSAVASSSHSPSEPSTAHMCKSRHPCSSWNRTLIGNGTHRQCCRRCVTAARGSPTSALGGLDPCTMQVSFVSVHLGVSYMHKASIHITCWVTLHTHFPRQWPLRSAACTAVCKLNDINVKMFL